MKKDDITQRYVRGQWVPAVNVKVYKGIESVTFPIALGQSKSIDSDVWETFYTDDGFNVEWIEANMTDEEQSDYFTLTCAGGFEYLECLAEEIFSNRHVEVYADGRSGGWAIVEGLPPIETWDAIMVARWSRFAKAARQVADDIPRSMAELIYFNVWETRQEIMSSVDNL